MLRAITTSKRVRPWRGSGSTRGTPSWRAAAITRARVSGETLAQACADLSFYPQVLINVRLPAGFNWQADDAIAAAKQDAERELGNKGRVLLRPSGTEPLLRVMVEGADEAQVERLARRIADVVALACDPAAAR